jgi:hypothetical protein
MLEVTKGKTGGKVVPRPALHLQHLLRDLRVIFASSR